MIIINTLDRNKSEELFDRIYTLSLMCKHLSGVVQNPDFINETNVYENYCIYKEKYDNLLKELTKVNDDICALHREIDEDETHKYS